MNDATPGKNTQQVVDRLRQMFGGSGPSSLGRTEAGRTSNFLLAVGLNAFARNGARKPLTDLEQGLVDAFRGLGYDDADLAAIGEPFTAAPAAARSAIFPARFAALGMETGYSLADLRADMPTIAEEFRRSPNLRVRDGSRYMEFSREELETIKSTLPEAQGVDLDQLMQHARSVEAVPEGEPEPGWSVICYAAPMNREATDPVQTKGFGRIRVWAECVDCEKGTHEWGNDEPFFGFAVTDDVYKQPPYQSPEFSMDEGDSRNFPANTLWDRTVAGGGLAIVVDGWEADNRGVYDRQVAALWQVLDLLMDQLSIETWADMVQVVVGELVGGIPDWVPALFAAVVAFVIRILSNPDDRLGTHPVLIPVPALVEMKAQKDIAANNPPEVALRLLAQRLGYSPGSIEYMFLQMKLMLGAFTQPALFVHMDHDRENHGIYDVWLRIALP